MATLLAERGEDLLVVPGLGSTTYDLAALGDDDRNFYLWGAMGGAAMIGLGLALAQPDKRVAVITGDGEMLMGMGALATIGIQRPGNLAIVVFDNGVYEVTGAQPTLAAPPLRRDAAAVNFADLARACGFRRVSTFDQIAAWRENVRRIIDGPGPTFVHLLVEPVLDAGLIGFPGPSPDRARAFREQLTRAESGRA